MCQFCNESCFKLHKERKRRWWWECKKCKTQFMASLKGNVEITSFRTEGEDKYYSLTLNYKTNSSQIDQYERNPYRATYKKEYFERKKIMDFPHLIKNVTPESAKDKIKTYILFS